MKTAVFCFSDNGCRLATRLCELCGILPEDVHTIERLAGKFGFAPHKKICPVVGELFASYEALIFIGACGIAIRDIAPHLKSKLTDPAVIVIDDGANFVIPLLSGHIGGANKLARELANKLSATAVVTTATDINGRFSCDEWAVRHNCAISSMKLAKDVSASILEGAVPVSSEWELTDALPGGLVRKESGELGIYIGIKKNKPYEKTLRLSPRIVTLGIGCRRGTTKETIEAVVKKVLEENSIDLASVSGVATIDVKKDEEGLKEFAGKYRLPIKYLSAEQLNRVEGEFEESEFVKNTVGVGNVCERAAAHSGGRIIIKKTAKAGVTVAASVMDWRVNFE